MSHRGNRAPAAGRHHASNELIFRVQPGRIRFGCNAMGKKLGLGFVFLYFMGGGIAHFARADLFVSIMPPYLPWHYAAVYISGAFEILGACGIVLPALRLRAGVGLIALTIAVTPANVHMWLHPELFPKVAPELLGIRLLLQVMLIGLIWWSTRTTQDGPQGAILPRP